MVQVCLSRAYAVESTDSQTPQNRRFELNRTPMVFEGIFLPPHPFWGNKTDCEALLK